MTSRLTLRIRGSAALLARIMHKFSTASPQASVLTVLRLVGLPNVLLHRYGGVRGERDGVKFAKRQRHDVDVHRGGGATKKLMPSPPPPFGLMGVAGGPLCRSSASMSLHRPSPCSLISPRKTHQRNVYHIYETRH